MAERAERTLVWNGRTKAMVLLTTVWRPTVRMSAESTTIPNAHRIAYERVEIGKSRCSAADMKSSYVKSRAPHSSIAYEESAAFV